MAALTFLNYDVKLLNLKFLLDKLVLRHLTIKKHTTKDFL